MLGCKGLINEVAGEYIPHTDWVWSLCCKLWSQHSFCGSDFMRTIYPSRIKRDFETYGTDHEIEVIEIFVLTLGSIRGGRFQFKQTVLWNEGTLNWPIIVHILTER